MPSFRTLGNIALLCVLLAAACAPPPQPAAPAAPAAPTGPKPAAVQKMVWADSTLGQTLDPHAVLGRGARRYDIFEALVAQDNAGAPAGSMLAQSWKSVDATTWQFSLFKDSLFQDGTPVTAADVKFSFDRALDRPKNIAVLQRIPTVKEVNVIDPSTVNIVTSMPDPVLLRRLAAVAVLPKAAFERQGDKLFGLTPVGSGPFKVKEFVPGDRVVLVPFNEHPRRKGKLQEVVIRNIPDTTARVAGLRTGELDFSMAVPFSALDTLKSSGVETFAVDFGQSGGFKLMAIEEGPLKDKRVRQAINYAVDKQLMVSQIYSGFTRVEQGQILQPEVFGFNPNLKPYPFDPKKAKELLAAAGYPTGFKTKMEAYVGSRPETKDVGVLIQSQLRDVGIDTDFTAVSDFAAWSDKFYGKAERAPILGTGINITPGMDADFGLVWFKSNQADGLRYYNNPEFDRAYEASISEMNEQKRKELIWKALETMYEDPPYLYTVQVAILFAHSKRLQGVEKRFDQEPWLEKLWVAE